MADLLARLIGECDKRLAALDAEAVKAAEDGALRVASHLRGKALEVRGELECLYGMEHRLVARFFDGGGPLAAVPSA